MRLQGGKRFFFQKRCGSLLWGLIVVYLVLFSSIAFLKYRSFSFHDIDLAVINQIFWNTVRGNLIVKQIGSATILNGGHVFLIAIILSPVYFLAQSPLTLLFLQSIALGLGAWPVYLIARDLIKTSAALVLAFCYLIYPALNYVNLFEFHPIAFSTPLLLFMFLFYVRKKRGLFLLFMILSLSCREDVSIPVFAFGVFALIQACGKSPGERKSNLIWGLVPLLSGLIWFIFCVKFLQPHFKLPELKAASGGDGMLGYYSWLGNSPIEIVRNVFTHPQFAVIGKPKLLYLFHLFIPLAFISLLSPSAMVMVLICLAEGLLSSRFTHYSIHYQYSSIITPFVFVAAIYGARNILRWKIMAGKEKLVLVIITICSIASAKAIGPLFKLPSGIKEWRGTYEDRIRQDLVEEVPSSEAVITTFEFTPKLSMRPLLYYFYHVYTGSRRVKFLPSVRAAQRNSRWALIDFNEWLTFYDFYTLGGDRDIYRFLTDGNWQLVKNINSLVLFRKGKHPELGLVEKLDRSEIQDQFDLRVTPRIALRGVEIDLNRVGERPVATVQTSYFSSGRIPDDLLFLAVFSHHEEPGIRFHQFFWAPYRIYPTSRWQAGEYLRLTCNILIPEQAPAGEYDLTLAFVRKRPEAPPGDYDVSLAMKLLPQIWGVSSSRLVEQKNIYQQPKAVSLP